MPSLTDQVETMRSYPDQASNAFQSQLRKMKTALGGLASDRSRCGDSVHIGIDRSRELSPVERPALRTVALVNKDLA